MSVNSSETGGRDGKNNTLKYFVCMFSHIDIISMMLYGRGRL